MTELQTNDKNKRAKKSRFIRVQVVLLITGFISNLLSGILGVWLPRATSHSIALFIAFSAFFCVVFYKNYLALFLGVTLAALGAISLFLIVGLHLPKLPILTSLIMLSMVIIYLIQRAIKSSGGENGF